ncbi:hypothetical protein B0H10DRAFT_70465 [Mycena sp. CBHHK59/15]|nr:hypothetical protein B0H10DRAFT_70465 [Mycena sp. CBHHK59/15]
MSSTHLPPTVDDASPEFPDKLTVYENLWKMTWGKGDSVRDAIVKEENIEVPPIGTTWVDQVSSWAPDMPQAPASFDANGPPVNYNAKWLTWGSNRFDTKQNLLIRDEYPAIIKRISIDFDERIKESPEHSGSTIVIGWPGIGKTTFLYYYLICLLLKAESVLFSNGKQCFGFSKKGVQTVPWSGLEQLRRHADFHFCKFLCDAFERRPPPRQLYRNNNNFIVLTTSPFVENWKLVHKYKNGKLCYMKPCTWEEVYTVACVLYPYKPDTIKNNFQSYGPSFRRSMNVLSEDVDTATNSIRTLVTNLFYDSGSLVKAIRNMTESSSNMGDPSSWLFMPIPDSDSRIQAQLIPTSPYVFDLLIANVLAQEEHRIENYMKVFSSIPQAAIFRGWISEAKVRCSC